MDDHGDHGGLTAVVQQVLKMIERAMFDKEGRWLRMIITVIVLIEAWHNVGGPGPV